MNTEKKPRLTFETEVALTNSIAKPKLDSTASRKSLLHLPKLIGKTAHLILTPNVNDYLHFLKDTKTSPDSLCWIQGLRTASITNLKATTPYYSAFVPHQIVSNQVTQTLYHPYTIKRTKPNCET